MEATIIQHNQQVSATSTARFARLLSKIPSFWFHKPEPIVPRPISLANSSLGALPYELIVLISSFLPAESAVAFALSSRQINNILGLDLKYTLHKFNDRVEFLELLEKDLPSHVACRKCCVLHKPSNSVDDLCTSNLPCTRDDLKSRIQVLISKNCRYIVARLAMKRHRQGLDCTDLLKSMGSDVTIAGKEYMQQCISETRIIEGCLYFRIQHIFMIPPGRPHQFPIGDDVPEICRHYRCLQGSRFLFGFNSFTTCESCPTEFHVGWQYYGKYGTTMVLTKWKFLGKVIWRDLFWTHSFADNFSTTQIRIRSKDHSISTAFEGSTEYDFLSFLPRYPRNRFWAPLLFQRSPFPWPQERCPYLCRCWKCRLRNKDFEPVGRPITGRYKVLHDLYM